MADFDRGIRAFRREILFFASLENIYMIDLFDKPKLHFGFKDRMHLDQYGHFQLAKFITRSGDYKRFINAVKKFYEGLSSMEPV